MEIEIEMKLEDENWFSPGELLKWIKDSFTIDESLSY